MRPFSASSKSPARIAAFNTSPAWFRTRTDTIADGSRKARAASRNTVPGHRHIPECYGRIKSNDRAGNNSQDVRPHRASMRSSPRSRLRGRRVARYPTSPHTQHRNMPSRARRTAVLPVHRRDPVHQRPFGLEGRKSCRFAKANSERNRPSGVSGRQLLESAALEAFAIGTGRHIHAIPKPKWLKFD